MKTVSIICEYNPFHLGHAGHIEKTRQLLGDDVAVVCVMSGNFVQRGDFAVFNKQARAKMAVLSGADLVVELPTPYVLMSAEGFAQTGVCILDGLDVCDYLSFGSEANNIGLLQEAAGIIMSDNAIDILKERLNEGVSYATAQQFAADTLMGKYADVFKSPNNVLGIEYIKALNKFKSKMLPITVSRTGGDHDGDTGFSASSIRNKLLIGDQIDTLIPASCNEIINDETTSGRGPVSIKHAEQAIISRLRSVDDFSQILGISEGLEQRFIKYAHSEPTIEAILTKIKTKRYPMSRLRRILLCSVLNITKEYTDISPPYIKISAMNDRGALLLKKARKQTKLPIITKPAAVNKLCNISKNLFNLEVKAIDFYTLAYSNENERFGKQEWYNSPTVLPL